MNDDTLLTLQGSPGLFVEEILGERITVEDVLSGNAERANAPTDAQDQIQQSVVRNKFTCVKSANNAGKSYIAARIALWFISTFPESIVITTAPKATQVRDILWGRIREAHTHSEVKIGGQMWTTMFYPARDEFPNWLMRGVTSKTAESASGYHAPYILVIIDEASGVLGHVYSAMEGVLSSVGARCLEISNPTTKDCDFYRHCNSDRYNTIAISAWEHPNVIHQREIYRGAVAPSWPQEMLDEYGEDSAIYQVRVLGEFPAEEENTIIPLHFIEAAIDREVEDDCSHTAHGCDVARKGNAETVLYKRAGQRFAEEFTEQKTDLSLLPARILSCGARYVGVDDVGVGGGVTDNIQATFRVRGDGHCLPFVGNAISDEEDERRKREHFEQSARRGVKRTAPRRFRSQQERKTNVRFKDLESESWWKFRLQLEETFRNVDDPTVGVSIPNDKELHRQLNERKYTTDNDVIDVVSKSKIEGRSDKADALVITDRTHRRTRHFSRGG